VPGETVKLFLRNDGPEHLGFAFCGEPMERRVKGGWVEIQNDLGPCPGFLPSIDPGIAVIVSYGLRTDHQPGEYRVRPWFSTTSKGRFFRRSNTFTIR
jgi:hypothetical protein